MLELRLFYQYINSTCYTLDASSPPDPGIWKDALMARFVFTSDAMLYSIMALSAQHISQLNSSDTEASAASLEYLSMALPLHRHDVNTLNKSNADLVCLTGAILRLLTYATLPSRPITPYTPPMQFLLQARGSSAIFQSVYAFVRDDPDSIAKYMLDRAGYRQRDVSAGELPFGINQSHRRVYQHLLHRSEEHIAGEPWSGNIERAYEDTLAYLGAVQSLSAAGSPVRSEGEIMGLRSPNTTATTTTYDSTRSPTTTTNPTKSITPAPSSSIPLSSRLRRLILFPSLCPPSYIDLVSQSRPRALVILAQYFALLAEFGDVWWVGKLMGREVRGVLDYFDGQGEDEEKELGSGKGGTLSWEREMVRGMIQGPGVG